MTPNNYQLPQRLREFSFFPKPVTATLYTLDGGVWFSLTSFLNQVGSGTGCAAGLCNRYIDEGGSPNVCRKMKHRCDGSEEWFLNINLLNEFVDGRPKTQAVSWLLQFFEEWKKQKNAALKNPKQPPLLPSLGDAQLTAADVEPKFSTGDQTKTSRRDVVETGGFEFINLTGAASFTIANL